MAPCPDDPDRFDLDVGDLYARYLVTCRMSGVEPVPRERALDTLFPVKRFLSRS